MRRSTRKAIEANGGRNPNRTKRRISPPSWPPSQKKTATPPSTTFSNYKTQDDEWHRAHNQDEEVDQESEADGGRNPNRTKRRSSPPSWPPSQKKTATPPSTTFNSFFIQQTQNAAYCKYLINQIKHTSVPTLVDSSKVRRDNKNGRMSAPVSKDTLSQTSSTTTTFSNYKTQDHNFIYTTMPNAPNFIHNYNRRQLQDTRPQLFLHHHGLSSEALDGELSLCRTSFAA
jgi:hypothetical protein